MGGTWNLKGLQIGLPSGCYCDTGPSKIAKLDYNYSVSITMEVKELAMVWYGMVWYGMVSYGMYKPSCNWGTPLCRIWGCRALVEGWGSKKTVAGDNTR